MITEYETKCSKLAKLSKDTLLLCQKVVKSIFPIYHLRKQPLTDQEAVTMALGKKIYFAYECLIDDAEKMRPEAMHHLKTMVECTIYYYYVDKNGDSAARTVLCQMAKDKEKFIKNNSDFSSSKEQIKYWQDTVKNFGGKGISVACAAKNSDVQWIYNRIYRQACEPAHLADLYEYLPSKDESIMLIRSATSPVWASTTLYQATNLMITLLTDVSHFFNLNIENRLADVKANIEKNLERI